LKRAKNIVTMRGNRH